MPEVVAILRKWGNSLGVVIPREIVMRKKWKQKQKVFVSISEKEHMKARDVFGMIQSLKKFDTERVLKAVDDELESKWVK